HQPLARWRSRLAAAIAERRAAHVAGAARIAARIFVEKPNALRRRLAAMWAGGRWQPRVFADSRQQPGDDLALRCEDLPPGVGGRKPLRAVDFGKRRLASALRRPFQLEPVRRQRRRVEVAFEPPGGDDLAAGLNDLTERKEIALGTGPGLL